MEIYIDNSFTEYFHEDALVIRASTLSIESGYGYRAIGYYISLLGRGMESGEKCKCKRFQKHRLN